MIKKQYLGKDNGQKNVYLNCLSYNTNSASFNPTLYWLEKNNKIIIKKEEIRWREVEIYADSRKLGKLYPKHPASLAPFLLYPFTNAFAGIQPKFDKNNSTVYLLSFFNTQSEIWPAKQSSNSKLAI